MPRIYKIEGYLNDYNESYSDFSDIKINMQNAISGQLVLNAVATAEYNQDSYPNDSEPWNTTNDSVAIQEFNRFFSNVPTTQNLDSQMIQFIQKINEQFSEIKPRDPNRIDTVLQLIGNIWKKYPDYRLCQLIENIKPNNMPDLFYIEDSKLCELLSEHYEKVDEILNDENQSN